MGETISEFYTEKNICADIFQFESDTEMKDVDGISLQRAGDNQLPNVNERSPSVVYTNDEYLTLCLNPGGKGTAFLHVWVIR